MERVVGSYPFEVVHHRLQWRYSDTSSKKQISFGAVDKFKIVARITYGDRALNMYALVDRYGTPSSVHILQYGNCVVLPLGGIAA